MALPGPGEDRAGESSPCVIRRSRATMTEPWPGMGRPLESRIGGALRALRESGRRPARHRPRVCRPDGRRPRSQSRSIASSPRTGPGLPARCQGGAHQPLADPPPRRSFASSPTAGRAARPSAASSSPHLRAATETSVLDDDPRARPRAAGDLQQGRGDGAALRREQGDRAGRPRSTSWAVAAQRASAIGDAENDHAFLELCECSVAVAIALPRSREAADLVTMRRPRLGRARADRPDPGLRPGRFGPRPSRHAIRSAPSRTAARLRSGRRRQDLLVTGASGSGRIDVATGLLAAIGRARLPVPPDRPRGRPRSLPGAVVLEYVERLLSVAETLGRWRHRRRASGEPVSALRSTPAAGVLRAAPRGWRSCA